MYIGIYGSNSTTKTTSISGDWKHFASGTEIFKSLLTVDVEGIPATAEEIINDASLMGDDGLGNYLILRNSAFDDAVLNNFKTLLNKSYLTYKTRTFWTYTGVFFGIYAALVIFMGLMTFLLTRGKKNPMNYLTYWTTTKIAMWAAFCPGLLAMILGFMIANFATMFFIILYGLRIMWLSMRQLRPQVQ